MENKLFQTPGEIEASISSLKTLLSNPGWQLLVDIFKENMATLSSQALDPQSELSEEELRLLRWRRRYMEILIETPEKMIRKLSGDEPEEVDLDPYDVD